MEGQRLLIVNADGFGRSAESNRAIIEAHRSGIVTSASVMVRRAGAAEAARASREHPGLSVGLHLDLCEWEKRDGEWHLVESVAPLDDGDRIAEEILYQLASFRALFSRDPTHLDSHQDVHRSDPTRSLLLTVARKLGIPLRHFASEIHVCSGLPGFAGLPGDADDRPRSTRGLVDHLRTLLADLPPGCTELVYRGDVGAGREPGEAALEALCHPAVVREIDERGIRRISFHELGSRTRSGRDPQEGGLRERGRAAYDRQDFHQAAFWFRRETSVAPGRPWPWLWLSRAQLRTGDLVGSRMSVDRALDICPGWPPGLLHLADLHLETDREDAAAEVLERLAGGGVNGAAGTAVGARIARGVARRVHRLNDSAAALRVARALARRHPDQDSAVAAEAISLWRGGGADGDASQLQRAEGRRSVRAAAEIELELGNPRKAWTLIRTAPLVEDDRELVTAIGHALRRAGDLTGAWEALERSMELGATDAVVRHWRESVLGEVHVLSGVWTPRAPRVEAYAPFPARILHLVERTAPPARDARAGRVRERAVAQKEAGLDPHVVARTGFPDDHGPHRRMVELDGIPHHRVDGPAGGERSARLDQQLQVNLRELGSLVRRIRPSVLHAGPDYRNALLALAVKGACGIPVVYEVPGLPAELWRTRGTEDAGQPLARRWRLARELECMRVADRVVVPGESIRAALVERGVPDRKLEVVSPAVDTDTFAPGPADRELARSLGILPGEVVLGTIVGDEEEADVAPILEAVARFVRGNQPVKGMVVGRQGSDALLRAVEGARTLGIRDSVIVAADVPRGRLPDHYRLIDIFVGTRGGDTECPAAAPPELFEAMAVERAVVVPGVEQFRETVLPGVTGFVADRESPDALVSVLEPLVGSQELRAGMGRAARRWVTTNRSTAKAAERWIGIYGSLRGGPRERAPRTWKADAASAFRVASPPRTTSARGSARAGANGNGAPSPGFDDGRTERRDSVPLRTESRT